MDALKRNLTITPRVSLVAAFVLLFPITTGCPGSANTRNKIEIALTIFFIVYVPQRNVYIDNKMELFLRTYSEFY